MFGDPDNNPKGFNIKTIKEVSRGKLSYGIAASAVDYDGETRYIRITDIDEHGNLNSDCKSPDEYDEQFLLHEGDILFARSGATVGKTYQYHLAHGKALYAGYLIRSIPDTNVIEPTFLFQSTKTAYYDGCIGLLKRGATQPNINAQQYGDLKIIVPPIALQRDFIRFVEQVDKSKLLLLESLKNILPDNLT